MAEAPRSNRPTPRTAAAVEAELRRRIRAELTQARAEADGQLDDATLGAIIARAVTTALSWHLEAPEHTRNATVSSRTWRPAGGPRGGGPPREEYRERPFEPRGPRDFRGRPPRGPYQDRGPYEERGPFQERGPYQERGPRDYQERGPYQDRGPNEDRGPRDYQDRDFPPRRGFQDRPPRPRGGGFGPRRPPRKR